MPSVERKEVVVIGAGQSGLAVGYHLKKRGIPFTILDSNERVGDVWRKRWDSLRLFTPARYDGLVGMPFPAPANSFPTKDEMADYLESYAHKFELPVETGVTVDRLSRRGRGFVVSAVGREIEAKQVVVAMSSYQRPVVPIIAGKLRSDITQLHSIDYKNPEQLRDGKVLIVGAGNSGAEIGLELARAGRSVLLAGRDVGHVPFRGDSFLGRHVMTPLVVRFVFHHVLTVNTPMGRKVRAAHGVAPLIRVKPKALLAAGVKRVARVTDARAGLPTLEDGSTVDVTNVIWCSGFDPGFWWIDLPVFDEHNQPLQQRGVVEREPGLHFVGLQFQYAMSSTMIHGVSRDAGYVANRIALTYRSSTSTDTSRTRSALAASSA